ncbi:DMT family transporter [Halarcobacter bivalviorum]|uniref:EamA family transporter n=1 Tax=Halarcobacter bivalviorum TaxID=663364 RepID=A0AAX2A7E2_9BACT|nr:DMT family transporter [Halarcobacter bivalviorum]AXH11055.1 EamA/RhaT family transporter [Halarcobacter bivalviorum]RXK09755.1 EamA family transporter [Halarcobacter bivalviorum]
MRKDLTKSSNLLLLNIVALIFLASNSILCKLAIVNEYADAYSFTFLRLVFASLTLYFIVSLKYRRIILNKNKNWFSAFFLFLYAITFSYAYLDLDAGLGTLILFALVQLTMISYAIFTKEKISIKQFIGIFIALFGLIYLFYPKDDFTLSIKSFILISLAGISWGVYTILGKRSKNALKDTNDNFLKTIPFLLLYLLIFPVNINITTDGLILSFLSGAVTSAIGYVIWYKILDNISIITAGVIQLIVPIIAIVLSVVLLDELLTSTLVISTLLIIIGIYLTISKSRV